MRLTGVAVLAAALAGYATAAALPFAVDDMDSAQRGGGGVRGQDTMSGTRMVERKNGSGTKDVPIVIRLGGDSVGEMAVKKRQNGSGSKDDPIITRLGGESVGEVPFEKRQIRPETKDEPIIRMAESSVGGMAVEKRQPRSGTKDDPNVTIMGDSGEATMQQQFGNMSPKLMSQGGMGMKEAPTAGMGMKNMATQPMVADKHGQ
ncbi:hypothetical protein OQA88_12012 [Cercophora sp. LCS_1]